MRENMIVGRHYHDVCLIGPYIYVVGGRDNNRKAAYLCERYHTLANKWELLQKNAKFDMYCTNVSIVAVKKRYIFAFGGRNENRDYPINERVTRLDTFIPIFGWKIITFQRP